MTADVIEISRSWVGTPYHSGASLKQVGCDCFGFITGVYYDCTGVKIHPSSVYDNNWTKDKDNKHKLKENLDQMGEQVNNLLPGDILIFAINDDFYVHCGIYNGDTFFHALEDMAVNKVVETCYNERWKQRHSATYRFKWLL